MLKYLLYVVILISITGAAHSLKWCCKSQEEMDKCLHLSDPQEGLQFKFGCHMTASADECVQAITDGSADVMALDGGEIYQNRNELFVVAAEDSGMGEARYYAVAVVKNGHLPKMTLRSLDGKRTCHTGVGKSSGWNMPIGWMYKNGVNPNLFLESCAPGAKDAPYTNMLPDPENSPKWCALCGETCIRNSNNPYYGYHGALKCLKEMRGDVAFVKHTTVSLEERHKYQLLCPDGTRKAPSEWKICNLAKVPSHGIVVRAEGDELAVAREVFSILRSSPRILEYEFQYYVKKNLLWSSSTTAFLPVFQRPEDFLGRDYFCNMRALESRGSFRDGPCTTNH